jgi:Rieske Fe-S protein
MESATPAGCGCGADAQRRMALKAAAGLVLLAGAGIGAAQAADDGPRTGDWLVLADDEAKKPLGAADVKLGAKPLIAYPYDPSAKAVRDSSRMNRIVLVRLDPGSLDGATQPRAAEGVVAYSAFCTHMGCDVNAWVAAEKVLLCYCHFSKFDPSQEAAVTGGPAPRPLPALPIKLEDGKLVVAGAFSAPPGKAA